MKDICKNCQWYSKLDDSCFHEDAKYLIAEEEDNRFCDEFKFKDRKIPESDHAENLIYELEHIKEGRIRCPDGEYRVTAICSVCCGFIGLEDNGHCPCFVLGKEGAVKRSWIALEEKGYI